MLQNRNLLAKTWGLHCSIRSTPDSRGRTADDEHVLEPFRFNVDQITQIEQVLTRRANSWRLLLGPAQLRHRRQSARIHPCTQEVKAGESVSPT